MTDILEYNSKAWDSQVEKGNEWTVPVSPEEIAAARKGVWQVHLTEQKYTPREWFPESIAGLDILGLASGGGQQGPIFAAAGANVTVLDNSARQLAADSLVADREGLQIRTVQGNMADLSLFADASFDLVFHPVSNLFSAEIRPVWRGAFRILRRGGLLLSGFILPLTYIFDLFLLEKGELQVKYTIPYSDQRDLPPEQLQLLIDDGSPFEFGHSLEDQIGGQTDAGFVITSFQEDFHNNNILAKHIATYGATRALKP